MELNLSNLWKILKAVEYTKKETSLDDLALGLSVETDEIEVAILKMRQLGLDTCVKLNNGKKFVVPSGTKGQVFLDLSLIDWVALSSSLDQKKLETNPELKKIVDSVVSKINRENVIANLSDFDMEKPISRGVLVGTEGHINHRVIKFLEDSMIEKSACWIKLKNGNSVGVFPHKLVYLEGDLCIVSEDISDKCLVAFKVDDILEIDFHERAHRPVFSFLEINDFVNALRLVSGNEQRLVLKILQPEKVDLNPPYHYLGNPYLTSNAEGEIIWAASVENSNDILSWLATIEEHVEILDPISLKKELAIYKEGLFKRKKVA